MARPIKDSKRKKAENYIEKPGGLVKTPSYGTDADNSPKAKSAPAWSSLFAFTTRKHIVPLCAALLLSIASGVVQPILAIFLGKVFDAFSSFGTDKLDEVAFKHKITKDCLILVGLGAASWLMNAGFFLAWLAFGELQAKSCRAEVFDGLLLKQIAWFDKRKSGVAASMTRIQAYARRE